MRIKEKQIIPISVHRDTIVGSVLSILDVLRPASGCPAPLAPRPYRLGLTSNANWNNKLCNRLRKRGSAEVICVRYQCKG